MLDNIELHEKIAATMNRVMSNISTCEANVDDPFNEELNSAIHSVVEQTEADPVFQRLLDDIFLIPHGV